MEQVKPSLMDRPVRLRWVARIVAALIVLALVGYIFSLFKASSIRSMGRDALRDQIRKEGIAIAQTIAVTSRDDILSKDYSKLQSYFADLVKEDGVQYIMVVTPGGTATVHTNSRDRGKYLDDEISRKAVQANDTLVQTIEDGKTYDVAVPVMGLTKKEATVRVGISYARSDDLYK